MNARLQRLLLLMRCILALSIGLIAELQGLSPWWTALLAVLGFYVHAPVILALFLSLRWLTDGESPPPAIPTLLRAWWRELWANERVFALWQPFLEHQEPDHLPDPGAEGRGRRGVLLLHGFSCNRALWRRWQRRLRARGHPFIALSLEPAFGSIDRYVETIEAAVQRLEAVTGQAPLILAHSMGGLAARAWWRCHGRSGRLQRLITLGTPHAGTRLASLSPARNASEMRRGSRWLLALAQQEPATLYRDFDCYWSPCDQIVAPARSAVLPGCVAHRVEGCGHLALVEHPAVVAGVLARLSDDTLRRPDQENVPQHR